MKRKKLIEFIFFLTVALIALVFVLTNSYSQKQHPIKNFEDCANAGFPVMESYPRQCAAYGKTYIEEISNENSKIYCTEEQRNVGACIEIYQPVCGSVQVECITEPCNPIPQTFENSCKACSNEKVEYYTKGEC